MHRIGAFLGARHADQLDAKQTQRGEQVPVTGVVNQYTIASLEQVTGDDIERLSSAMRQYDLIGCGADAEFFEPGLQVISQGAKAARRSVRDNARIGLPGERTNIAPHTVFVEPVRRQPADTRFDVAVGVVEILVKDAGIVEGALVFVRDGGRRAGIGASRHEETSAAPRLQVAECNQAIVTFDDGEAAHRMGLRKAANRR